MTIAQAIERINALKQNTYTTSDKIEWLSRLDAMVKRLIIDVHEGADEGIFDGYTDQTDKNTELLVPAPFDEVYLLWLESQINYYNGEYDKYNASILMYQTAFEKYANYYRRDHMPKSRGARFIF